MSHMPLGGGVLRRRCSHVRDLKAASLQTIISHAMDGNWSLLLNTYYWEKHQSFPSNRPQYHLGEQYQTVLTRIICPVQHLEKAGS